MSTKPTKVRDNKSLFVQKKREVGIGRAAPFKTDLTRFVRWPKYVRHQRQKRILMKRMVVPGAVAQFSKTANKALAHQVVTFLQGYKPESVAQKAERLQKKADAQATSGQASAPTKKEFVLTAGVNEVVKAIERQKAQLVVIAHDVDPLDVVLYLPALCVKMDVPYVIVKSKSRLGELVGQKTTAAVALKTVKKSDRDQFAKIVEACRGAFNSQYSQIRRKSGGGQLSKKSSEKLRKKQKKE